MPSNEELEKLMVDLESDRVERKESLSDKDRVQQAICAFANDLPAHRLPGYLFMGVNDAGVPTNLAITDQLLIALADLRSSGNILPIPTLHVQKVVLRGSPVAVVEVLPSDAPPVRFKGQVYIRAGPRRAIATLEEERRLTERQTAAARTFDARPCADSSLEDLKLDVFQLQYLPRVVAPSVLAENRRSCEEQLASLRFFDIKRGVPTFAGILLFGKNPRHFLPGAYVQFARFDGVTLADPVLDAKEVQGHLPQQLDQIDNLLPIQIRVARVPVEGLRHEDRPDYPKFAVRELVFNGLLHRTYEGSNAPVRLYWFRDRVEIQSPGGLYGAVTPENYDRINDYRNPVLAEAMKALGYVERFGTGIARARSSLRANGNPAPDFVFEPTHVRVTIRSASPGVGAGAA
jgi:ATP-dependent DNA helicase RecG